MSVRWLFGSTSSRDAFRDLLDGDLLFFNEDPAPGGGDDPPGGGGGDDPPPGPAPSDDPPGGGGDDPDKAETVSGEKYREKLAEAKSLRDRLRTAERERDELKRKDESDAERRERELEERTKRAETAEAQARQLRVEVAASRVGILPEYARAAAALVDWENVDQDDEEAVEKALKGLKDKHSRLFKSSDVDAGKKDRSKQNGELGDDATPQQRLKHAYAGSDN